MFRESKQGTEKLQQERKETIEPHWEKEGDLSTIHPHPNVSRSEVEYKQGNHKLSIRYLHNPAQPTTITFETDKPTLGEIVKLCSKRDISILWSAMTDSKAPFGMKKQRTISSSTVGSLVASDEAVGGGFDVVLEPKSIAYLIYDFIQIIDEVAPLTNSIKREVYKLTRCTEGFCEAIKELADTKFEEAFAEVKAYKDDDIFWALGQHCETRNAYQYAIRCYEAIPKSNEHFKEANQRIANLKMSSIKPNHETLFALADVISSLRKENQELRALIAKPSQTRFFKPGDSNETPATSDLSKEAPDTNDLSELSIAWH